MLELDPAHLRLLRVLARAHLRQAELWAYGSRVTGQAHAGSDLDLVVRSRGGPSQTVDGLPAFRAALAASGLPILVDVSDWAELPGWLRAQIERRHERLWPAGDGP